ncbi:hypothetical protein C8J57DRAFT_1513919 [Mycena rebaudengoi]|nr:hypothetical protein C8J57DRAFT_1737062 [Mycena rebaudengoi]KAJ7237860.1 hypothetical protein C8J57DRAFT_1727825 [Mycena rebaudengoi]KAJ7262137.1 hypothetical protein C8J57DRAFT_1513919 [Mycena rebaudengoi]
MSDNPGRELIVYTASQFSYPHPQGIGNLQKGEVFQKMDWLLSLYLMYSTNDHDEAHSDCDDDDDIPDLLPCCDLSPQLLTYRDGCIHNYITIVKSKL